ncbi:hypothetical protein EYF80_051747 [Liparis tanakae]|uniref:Uncharacterized protein n=1 Tax=Liparis tanakae TaxID=230148 RepID=A0A4Z2FA64_9TELE|nr:hypothetical protein EYF80_051747 [Liparis tanakae]
MFLRISNPAEFSDSRPEKNGPTSRLEGDAIDVEDMRRTPRHGTLRENEGQVEVRGRSGLGEGDGEEEEEEEEEEEPVTGWLHVLHECICARRSPCAVPPLRCHLDRRDNHEEADGHTGILPVTPSNVIFRGNEQECRRFKSHWVTAPGQRRALSQEEASVATPACERVIRGVTYGGVSDKVIYVCAVSVDAHVDALWASTLTEHGRCVKMRPAGRGSRTDVGHRPFGGGQASDGNSLEAQIPKLTAETRFPCVLLHAQSFQVPIRAAQRRLVVRRVRFWILKAVQRLLRIPVLPSKLLNASGSVSHDKRVPGNVLRVLR